MSNTSYPLATDREPASLFIATQSGPLQRALDNLPIRRGLVLINSTTALALTLAAPVAGQPGNGGQDGCELRIVVTISAPLTAQITHSVSCSGGINGGTFSTINLDGSAGDSISLVAFNGYWWKYIGSANLT